MTKQRDFIVNIRIADMPLAEINDLERLLRNKFPSRKDNFDVSIIDPVGGTHYNGYGIMPDGEKCAGCLMINCNECDKWTHHATK